MAHCNQTEASLDPTPFFMSVIYLSNTTADHFLDNKTCENYGYSFGKDYMHV